MQNDIETGGSAFPAGVNQSYTDRENGEPTQYGMTLRDYFAAKAMLGLIAEPQWGERGCQPILSRHSEKGEPELSAIATASYRLADAMIAARMGSKL